MKTSKVSPVFNKLFVYYTDEFFSAGLLKNICQRRGVALKRSGIIILPPRWYVPNRNEKIILLVYEPGSPGCR